ATGSGPRACRVFPPPGGAYRFPRGRGWPTAGSDRPPDQVVLIGGGDLDVQEGAGRNVAVGMDDLAAPGAGGGDVRVLLRRAFGQHFQSGADQFLVPLPRDPVLGGGEAVESALDDLGVDEVGSQFGRGGAGPG